MNYQPLMKYIACHLHTHVHRFQAPPDPLDSFCERADLDDTEFRNLVVHYCFCQSPQPKMPLLLAVNETTVYGWIPAPGFFYLVGPLCLQHPFTFLHQIHHSSVHPGWLENVSVCAFSDMIRDILLLFHLEADLEAGPLTENDVLSSSFLPGYTEDELMQHYSSLVFENQEKGKSHNPYDQEIREQSSIENGDMEQLRQSIAEEYEGELGTLSKDPLRNEKNLAICVVAVSCRSAIRGGLAPEMAFSLSDSYIQKIDECKTIPDVQQLLHSAEYKYTEMVHELRKKQTPHNAENPHIQRCKDFIFSHLHDKLEVQDIADALSLSPNYLSELFRKQEGITLNQFIHQTKIDLAKNMLIYSPYSYIEIAAYLGYASQSHLGRQFKKITGYTPDKYRKQFGVKVI